MLVITKEQAKLVGGRVRAARETNGATAIGLDTKFGLPLGSVSHTERGEVTGWNTLNERLNLLAQEFGVPVASFLRGIKPVPRGRVIAPRKPKPEPARKAPVRPQAQPRPPLNAPAAALLSFQNKPSRENLTELMRHLEGMLPAVPAWADEQARAGLEGFIANPQLRPNDGEPAWFVEFQRRIQPHLEAEAQAMLEEIP